MLSQPVNVPLSHLAEHHPRLIATSVIDIMTARCIADFFRRYRPYYPPSPWCRYARLQWLVRIQASIENCTSFSAAETEADQTRALDCKQLDRVLRHFSSLCINEIGQETRQSRIQSLRQAKRPTKEPCLHCLTHQHYLSDFAPSGFQKTS